VDDLAPVVDVVDEAVERADALGEPPLDRPPLRGGDDPGDQVERERPVADGPFDVRPAGVERDALLQEDRVAPAAGGREPLGGQLLERLGEGHGVGPRAVGRERLVALRRQGAGQRPPSAILRNAS
jgi:hypothetical protein